MRSVWSPRRRWFEATLGVAGGLVAAQVQLAFELTSMRHQGCFVFSDPQARRVAYVVSCLAIIAGPAACAFRLARVLRRALRNRDVAELEEEAASPMRCAVQAVWLGFIAAIVPGAAAAVLVNDLSDSASVQLGPIPPGAKGFLAVWAVCALALYPWFRTRCQPPATKLAPALVSLACAFATFIVCAGALKLRLSCV